MCTVCYFHTIHRHRVTVNETASESPQECDISHVILSSRRRCIYQRAVRRTSNSTHRIWNAITVTFAIWPASVQVYTHGNRLTLSPDVRSLELECNDITYQIACHLIISSSSFSSSSDSSSSWPRASSFVYARRLQLATVGECYECQCYEYTLSLSLSYTMNGRNITCVRNKDKATETREQIIMRLSGKRGVRRRRGKKEKIDNDNDKNTGITVQVISLLTQVTRLLCLSFTVLHMTYT